MTKKKSPPNLFRHGPSLAKKDPPTFSGNTHRTSESSDSFWPEDFTKLQDDVAQMRNLIQNPSAGEISTESPLTRAIEKARIDRTLKTPSVDQFDGSSDPTSFLNTFDGRMSFYGPSEVARCRFFSTCLKGTTLRWYNNLPPRSIDSWQALKSKFQGRFSSNDKGGKITASLMTMRQRSSESLRDYLTRFRAEVADIPNLIEELAINYLAAGIDKNRHATLLEEFFEKNPRTL